MTTIEEYYSAMVAEFQSQTGLDASASGDLAVRLYAVAAQLYALDVQTQFMGEQCFPQTATGTYLDQHATLRGLTRHEATYASGTITFSCDSPSTMDWSIPAGTICMTASLIRFETTEDVTLNTGDTTVSATAVATEAGESGNVGSGTILTMAVPPVGIASCINNAPFTGGGEAENDETLRARILETYQRLQNGANVAYYRESALAFDQVTQVAVMPRARGIGTVDVVIATQEGIPDTALLAEVQAWFDEWREIGVDVDVCSPDVTTVNITAKITPASAIADVEVAIANWFSGERLGESILIAQLIALICSVDGVTNCTVTLPTADISVDEDELPMLGTLTIASMEG